jgi:CheY-like chemotaxis protein/anti-sigma regulatory factor (Ser/Thr protein kinase)
MVKKLLCFARQTPAEERELQLNGILREEIHLLEHTTLAKFRIQVDLASDLRPILGDAGALSHAFMNLCVNAVDAMPGMGTLTFRTRNVDPNWIEACVEDTGIGMTREILAQAMDPFFTTKGASKGTGLGLSMVYSTVKAHHGRIEIQSEPNQGTRVVMGFPAYASDPRPARPARPEEQPPPPVTPKGLNVWVVDDDELILHSTELMLGALGHSVTLASSGEEALGKIAAGAQPELMIMDWNMPGLGGEGTLPRLRALCPALPVLLATGRPDQSAMNLLAADAHTSLLPKPFSMATMSTEIAAAMSRIHQAHWNASRPGSG